MVERCNTLKNSMSKSHVKGAPAHMKTATSSSPLAMCDGARLRATVAEAAAAAPRSNDATASTGS